MVVLATQCAHTDSYTEEEEEEEEEEEIAVTVSVHTMRNWQLWSMVCI